MAARSRDTRRPVLTGTPEAFIEVMKDQPEVKVIAMNPGQTIE